MRTINRIVGLLVVGLMIVGCGSGSKVEQPSIEVECYGMPALTTISSSKDSKHTIEYIVVDSNDVEYTVYLSEINDSGECELVE